MEDYVEFDKITGDGYPRTIFKEGTNKFLFVEIYEVDEEAEKRCDQLE